VKLTPEECNDIGKLLAEAAQKKAGLEQEKKESAATYKAQIDREQTVISENSIKLTSGYEYRFVKCYARLDDPERGRKTIIRTDTGETVTVTFMTEDDRQEELAIDSETKDGPAPIPN
jgi:hypothetical protein